MNKKQKKMLMDRIEHAEAVLLSENQTEAAKAVFSLREKFEAMTQERDIYRSDCGSKEQRIAELEDELAAVKQFLKEEQQDLADLIAEHKEQAAELTKEREARWAYEKGMADAQMQLSEALRVLEWYADENNFNQGSWQYGIFIHLVDDDGGLRARSILSSIEGGNDTQ